MSENDKTIKAYQENFSKYVEKTTHEVTIDFKIWIDAFVKLLPKNARVFELGSAFGRDAKYLKNKGIDVTTSDISLGAEQSLMNLGFDFVFYDFRDEPLPEYIGKYDGVFASHVLLHANNKTLKLAFSNVSRFLKTGGYFASSYKYGSGEYVENEKMGADRYFYRYNEESILDIVDKQTFEVIDVHTDKSKSLLFVTLRKIK